MTKTIALAATVVASLFGTAAGAEPLSAMHNETVDLGTTRGSAYYVVTRGGYHLVATLMAGRASTPIRFDATLADGQSATLSIPGPVGTNSQEVTFTRTSDHLVVHRTPDLRDVATQ